jgi:hypothetical protein
MGSNRRLSGGYIFTAELAGIRERSEKLTSTLVDFSRQTTQVDTLRKIVEMVALAGANTAAATDLLGYKNANRES